MFGRVPKMLELIKLSLWNTGYIGSMKVDQTIYQELKQHAIYALPAPILSLLQVSPELLQQWKKDIFQQISYNLNYKYIQEKIPITVPYVILKGTTAAQYYPHPEYRAMGDIDIMTRREDYDTACQELIKEGYHITTEGIREISLKKNDIFIDLHHYFASLNDPGKAEYLDNLIMDQINETHVLPDPINGLVLLEHISQHLEHGLGLRQIIDWMMFVDKCLPDEKWPEFHNYVVAIGLDTLAIVTTRMCELYLGLSERQWCAKADTSLCKRFMDYVLSCGNFGNKKTGDKVVVENVFVQARNPMAAIRFFQKRGLVNWEAAQRYAVLRPFAWIYQAGRYFFRGIRQKSIAIKLHEGHKAAKKRNAMMDALGVKQSSKGLVVYQDGKYVKK